MIIEVHQSDDNFEITENIVHVMEVAPFGQPDGMLESLFTAKGQLLSASGADTPVVIPAPVSNGLSPISDSSQANGWKLGVPSVSVEDNTNHLINGGFSFAQRQAPGTDTTITDEKYSADRWRITRENAALQFSRQDASGESGLTSRHFGKFTKITNAGKFAIYQPLEFESSIPLRGRDVVFQIQMKASAAKTIKIAIIELQAAGTSDSLPAAFVGAWNVDSTDPTLGTNLAVVGSVQSCSVTTAWQNFSVTGTIPSDSKNLILAIWSDADFSATDWLALAEAGFYRGSSTQTWAPRHKKTEQELCERYFRKSYTLDVAPGAVDSLGRWGGIGASTQYIVPFHAFPHSMRGTPSIAIYSPATGTASKVANFGGTDVGSAASAISFESPRSFRLIGDSGTPYAGGTLYFFHYTAEAEL